MGEKYNKLFESLAADAKELLRIMDEIKSILDMFGFPLTTDQMADIRSELIKMPGNLKMEMFDFVLTTWDNNKEIIGNSITVHNVEILHHLAARAFAERSLILLKVSKDNGN